MRVIGASAPGESTGLVKMLVSAVFIRIERTSAGERLGFAFSTSAAEPAIIGVAPEVPPKAVAPVPVPASADTEAPGAPMSGLMELELTLGPRADVVAMLPASETALALEMVTFTGARMFALMLLESDCWITSVGAKCVPPPKLNETASPGAMRPMRTPVAPLATARSTLRLTEHTPRSINATLPDGLDRNGSPGHPRPMYATLPVTPAPTGAQSTVAVLRYVPAIDAGELITSGITFADGTCVCATLITDLPIEGELTM